MMNPANASPLLQMLAAASDPLQAKAAEAALEQAEAQSQEQATPTGDVEIANGEVLK